MLFKRYIKHLNSQKFDREHEDEIYIIYPVNLLLKLFSNNPTHFILLQLIRYNNRHLYVVIQ